MSEHQQKRLGLTAEYTTGHKEQDDVRGVDTIRMISGFMGVEEHTDWLVSDLYGFYLEEVCFILLC